MNRLIHLCSPSARHHCYQHRLPPPPPHHPHSSPPFSSTSSPCDGTVTPDLFDVEEVFSFKGDGHARHGDAIIIGGAVVDICADSKRNWFSLPKKENGEVKSFGYTRHDTYGCAYRLTIKVNWDP